MRFVSAFEVLVYKTMLPDVWQPITSLSPPSVTLLLMSASRTHIEARFYLMTSSATSLNALNHHSCFPVQLVFKKKGYFRGDFIKGVMPLGNFLRYLLRYATLATELWASAFLGLCGGHSSGAAGSLMDEPIVPWLCDKWTNTGWRIMVEGAVRQWMVSKRPENMTAAASC